MTNACVVVAGKTKASKEEIEAERCPLCQVPLCLLAKGSQHQHVSECVNMHAAFLPGVMFSCIMRKL